MINRMTDGTTATATADQAAVRSRRLRTAFAALGMLPVLVLLAAGFQLREIVLHGAYPVSDRSLVVTAMERTRPIAGAASRGALHLTTWRPA